MAIQIDHVDTTVEIAEPRSAARPPRETAAPAAPPLPPAANLRDAVLEVVSDEIERFLRIRGLRL